MFLALIIPAVNASEQIYVSQWSPENSPCIAKLLLYNISEPHNITFTIPNTIDGMSYEIYNSSNYNIFGVGESINQTAEINAINITSGEYCIAETGNETVDVLYWNLDNVSCNAIILFGGINPADTIDITLPDATPNAVYKLYDYNTRSIYGESVYSNGNATITVSGIYPGEYRIAETGLEHILVDSWTPTNQSQIGKLHIYNSTPVSTWDFNISGYSNTLKLRNLETNDEYTLPSNNIIDGYYVLYSKINSYITETYVVATLIISTSVAALFNYMNKRRR